MHASCRGGSCSDLRGEPHAEQALVLLVAASGAGLIGDGVRAVLAGGDTAANAVTALGALAGAGDLALERAASGFSFGTNALALGVFGLAVRLTLGVLGLLLFVFEALGFVAGGVALGDLLEALGFFFLSDALALGFFFRESGGAGGLLLGLLARLFLLAFLQLARFFLLALFLFTLGGFGLERFFALGVFAGALGVFGLLLALFFFGLERFFAFGVFFRLLAFALFLLALFFFGLERSVAIDAFGVLARVCRPSPAFFFAAGALVAALAGFFLAGRFGFAAGFFLAGLRASLRRLGVAFAFARAFFGVAFFRTDIAEISGNVAKTLKAGQTGTQPVQANT